MKRLTIIKLIFLLQLCSLGGIYFTLAFIPQTSVRINPNEGSSTQNTEDFSINPKLSGYYTIKFDGSIVISDGHAGSYWNHGDSTDPDIAIDAAGNLHVVWEDDTDGAWGNDEEIFYANYTGGLGWSNITCVSDGYLGSYWNDGDVADSAAIAVDGAGNVHVVWDDETDGIWGIDTEIMYANYTAATGQWSNITVISDGYNDVWGWNDQESGEPDIAVDGSGNIHVVWEDLTTGKWGGGIDDLEIMYVNYTIATKKWSNITVISDGYNDVWGWNNGNSGEPSIAVDGSGNIHVVWEDNSIGKWGGGIDDYEIMYANYTIATKKWSNITVISDGYNDVWGWNNDTSGDPVIAIDGSNIIHVAWDDDTNGPWGNDGEIMYVNWTAGGVQLFNATVISDGYQGDYWNDDDSMDPDIAVNKSGIVHVVWEDKTNGIWGNDKEIMYARYNKSWSNPTVISGVLTGCDLNNGESVDPAIAVNISGDIHVVWEDNTKGAWGNDEEIMYYPYPSECTYFIPGFADDDDDDDEVVDLTGIIIITGIVVASVGGLAVLVVLIKKLK